MTGNFERREPQETTSRALDGIDYGRNVRVLARRGDTLLLWVPGQSAWSGTGQPWRYASSSLIVHLNGGRDYRRLASGGRLKVRLAEQAAAIDEHFGDGFHKLLEPSATIVVGDA